MHRLRAIQATLGAATFAAALGFSSALSTVRAAGPEPAYSALKPIQSGDLTLFPVVLNTGKGAPASPFLTLDEGLKSGDVEVTEAGSVRGLVRARDGASAPARSQGDQVNTLVLVNHSRRPLLLLAGEIVTGGKQDRIIAKDRIVPAGAEPIDLSVFCIEHGRWTEFSSKFGAAESHGGAGFMVQPAVRQEAMVSKDQQQVWNSVSGAISGMAVAAAPAAGQTVTVDRAGSEVVSRSLGTTSYAKAMQNTAVSAVVDRQAATLTKSREQILSTLKQQHAVGVVVALRGEIIWVDLFSDPDLLARYWTKLVRSYAAEGLGGSGSRTPRPAVTEGDAQRFLDEPAHGRESADGEVGVYRLREVKSGFTDLFSLESLLPGTGYEVHISKLKLKSAAVTPVSQFPRW